MSFLSLDHYQNDLRLTIFLTEGKRVFHVSIFSLVRLGGRLHVWPSFLRTGLGVPTPSYVLNYCFGICMFVRTYNISIHSIWILSVLYRISTYFIFLALFPLQHICYYFNQPTPYRLEPSSCLFFFICITFVVCKTGKTAIIHGFCLIISHTPSTIRDNIASLWSTYTHVSALNWY